MSYISKVGRNLSLLSIISLFQAHIVNIRNFQKFKKCFYERTSIWPIVMTSTILVQYWFTLQTINKLMDKNKLWLVPLPFC